MEYKIDSEKQYHEMMLSIYDLMNKGSENLAETELEALRRMTVVAEKFEDEVLNLKSKRKPASLTAMVELFMYENRLSQAKLASRLGMGKPKLSQILKGKRKPDVPFLKALYNELNIDPKFILDHI